MKKIPIKNTTTISVSNTYQGEFLERKLEKILESKEAIKAESPNIYTERNEGVLPQYDVRTDRWDIAQDVADKANKKDIAKRISPEKDNNGEPTQATSSTDLTGENQ